MPDPALLTIAVKTLEHFGDLDVPHYETALAAGVDLRAALPEDSPLSLAPMQRALIPTGFAMALPQGYEAQIRPRSGLALKYGITCLNTPGTIDADYRGEVKVLLINLGDEPFTVHRGERIAQMIIAPVTQGQFILRANLTDTKRGEGGFGSTGR